MNTQNTGGPAFPPMHDPETHCFGMTLRDYFAAKAMAGWQANPLPDDTPISEIATWAYRMADAMLEARK